MQNQSHPIGGCAYTISTMLHPFNIPSTLFSPIAQGILRRSHCPTFPTTSNTDIQRSDVENIVIALWKHLASVVFCLTMALTISFKKNGLQGSI